MPDTKISGMTNGGAVVATDNIPAVRAGANVRVQFAAVAGSGAYADLSGRPTLGSAAAQDTSAFATAAQGTLAGTAVQPGAITASGLTQATARLLGRSTAGTGAVEEITLGTNLSFTGTTLNAAGGGGSPGGSDGQIQRNNAGVLAGSNISQDAAGRITVAAGTQTTAGSALNLSYTANGAGQVINGLTVNMTDTASAADSLALDVRVGVSSRFNVRKSGATVINGNGLELAHAGTTAEIFTNAGSIVRIYPRLAVGWGFATGYVEPGITLGSGGSFAWTTGNPDAGTSDLRLYRDAANTLAQRNGAAAQTLRIYNNGDSTNGEWAGIRWNSNVAEIGPQAQGTGTVRAATAVGSWTFANPPRVPSYTVATLPVVGTGGRIARVTDSSVAASGNSGAIVAGGGANAVIVQDDGTNWRIL